MEVPTSEAAHLDGKRDVRLRVAARTRSDVDNLHRRRPTDPQILARRLVSCHVELLHVPLATRLSLTVAGL